jgi:uncharacterized protein (DUF697 family)
MAKLTGLTNTWDIVKEIDLKPLRQESLQGVKLAVIGAENSGRKTLAGQLRRDPGRESIVVDTPITILGLSEPDLAASADLLILILDARKSDFTREAELSRIWSGAKKPVLVLINDFDSGERPKILRQWVDWKSRRVVDGSILDDDFLTGRFARAVISLLPDKLTALGRYYPLFRVPVAHHLINDTSLSNATYSFSTGLAEIIPILNIPLTVTDMIVLTKNQAFLVYKLGLALGLSTEWQDYVAEFSGVLGGGFFWRQIARSLVGLVPLWGIVPKVGISYAGTYVVGNVVLYWYLTGRHVSREQMQALYSRAVGRGRELGSSLWRRLPGRGIFRLKIQRPRFPRLPSLRLASGKRKGVKSRRNVCRACGKRNPKRASYCLHCGEPLGEIQLASRAGPKVEQKESEGEDSSG